MPPLDREVSDTTQRVRLDHAGHISQSKGTASTGSAANSVRRNVDAQRKAAIARKKRNRRIAVIAAISAAAFLLIAVIVICSMFFIPSPTDNGLILNNVFVAGVNLGNMTVEQATAAVHAATDNTYTQLNMVVQVLDTTIELSPQYTHASLDVEAAVAAAYDYGRTGTRAEQKKAQNQANSSGYTVSIIPYLNLNTDYLQAAVDGLGAKYSTTKTDSTYEVVGVRPSMTQDEYDTSVAHQTLVIQIGTAEYGLNTSKLYQQILDAYNINLFQVVGECSMVAPDALDCATIYSQFCVEPVNAYYDESAARVVPEEYGYGFLLEDLITAVNNAAYGEEIEIPLTFIQPSITSEFYAEIYRDELATFTTDLSADPSWNTNVQLACSKLNEQIINSGEEFSFNNLLGTLSESKGYVPANVFVGKSYTELRGGGVCQVASTLYNCALLADLDILERHAHSYIPNFVTAGCDAEVLYGSLDLRFKNNTEYPIRIEASIENGKLTIKLIGTDNKDYTVLMGYKITNTVEPQTVYSTMQADNPSQRKDGDILSEGITGYTIALYKYTYNKATGQLISEDLISEVVYAKRDRVVVKIGSTQQAPSEDPTEPPENPTEPPENPTEEAPETEDSAVNSGAASNGTTDSEDTAGDSAAN